MLLKATTHAQSIDFYIGYSLKIFILNNFNKIIQIHIEVLKYYIYYDTHMNVINQMERLQLEHTDVRTSIERTTYERVIRVV